MLDAAERRLVAHCDALMEDALTLTRDLVKGYSVLGREQDALDTMEGWFARLGLSSERVALDRALRRRGGPCRRC